MMKKLAVLVALLLALTAFACAGEIEMPAGYWMNLDNGMSTLLINEDGSGYLMNADAEDGVAIQVTDARSEEYDFTICLGSEDNAFDLLYDWENESLTIHDDEDYYLFFERDYYDGEPMVVIAPDLTIRYEPACFTLSIPEEGSILLKCNYSEEENEYITISLVKDIDMATLLEGLALQSGSDDVVLSYGCWDFTEDQAGLVSYIATEEGKDYAYFFMAVACDSDCYLVESRHLCADTEEEDLTDLFRETLGSIRRLGSEAADE